MWRISWNAYCLFWNCIQAVLIALIGYSMFVLLLCNRRTRNIEQFLMDFNKFFFLDFFPQIYVSGSSASWIVDISFQRIEWPGPSLGHRDIQQWHSKDCGIFLPVPDAQSLKTLRALSISCQQSQGTCSDLKACGLFPPHSGSSNYFSYESEFEDLEQQIIAHFEASCSSILKEMYNIAH